jgi:hypothetical protein
MLAGLRLGIRFRTTASTRRRNGRHRQRRLRSSARCSYRDDNSKLFFAPLAANTYALTENAASFSPGDLQLQSVNRLVNDLTILGPLEPAAHVKDYFCGDGYTSYFYMSQKPFTRSSQVALYNRVILDETYTELDPTHWTVTDPLGVITVSNGQLQVTGGTGTDGQTLLSFVEQMELGGATMLEHGDVVFNAASDGVIGGLVCGAVTIADCVAGFRITPSGDYCNIQALVGGAVTGTPLATQAGHHYVFTTMLYPTETYRIQQVFHSSLYPSGSPRGGGAVVAMYAWFWKCRILILRIRLRRLRRPRFCLTTLSRARLDSALMRSSMRAIFSARWHSLTYGCRWML